MPRCVCTGRWDKQPAAYRRRLSTTRPTLGFVSRPKALPRNPPSPDLLHAVSREGDSSVVLRFVLGQQPLVFTFQPGNSRAVAAKIKKKTRRKMQQPHNGAAYLDLSGYRHRANRWIITSLYSADADQTATAGVLLHSTGK